jgi:serine/threonine protein phosphatase PrpC
VEIDERLQFKFAFRTRKGQHVNNPKKVNQDSILVKQNISKKDLHMIAVADGHGPSGHYVSQFVIKSLSKHFSEHINEFANLEDQKQTNPSTSPV